MKMKSISSGIAISIFGLGLVLAFQNCSQKGFSALQDQTSFNLASTSSTAQDDEEAAAQAEQSRTNETQTVVGMPVQNSPPVIPPVAVPTTEKLYNFVAADKASCDSSIQSNYGVTSLRCETGGGCGISCGKPGASCASANPYHFGACLSEAEINAAILAQAQAAQAGQTVQPQTKNYNFVAGDKATCENSIRSVLGIQASCSIGGGCGASCGIPGGSCTSANPSSWGACLVQ